jgi:hydrogenase maturation protease
VTTGPTPAIRMVVCGNADRGDDGVAPLATAALIPTLPPALQGIVGVRRRAELRVEDLLDVRPGERCVILDAVSGVAPGQVVRLPLDQLADGLTFTPRSSHQLPIGLVVGLASALRDRPLEGTFIGLGGMRWGYGDALAPATCAGLPAYRAAIEAELIRLAPVSPVPGRGG